MSDVILRAENLSKRYRIKPSKGQGWRRNQRVLADELASLVSRFRRSQNLDDRVAFWALQDVSFEARQGEIIGIIGRNGAGKSTLLKLLGRITEPTRGRAVVYGRMGTLLEVGTGFHSELTGRENIFLSGAIIGMSRAEIKQKFDEIVEFSGVEEFLDTPVKRFSSGMEVRLAFSVAAHLHPQVLLVDEVLSVGDANFQQKSIKKIREVAEYGGTILFVSHNMNTVTSLCNKAIVLENGKVAYPLGPTNGAVDHYLVESLQTQKTRITEGRQGIQPGKIRITEFSMVDPNGTHLEILTTGQPVQFRVRYSSDEGVSLKGVGLSILIRSIKGDLIANLNSQMSAGELALIAKEGQLACKLDKFPIAPGSISISLVLEQNGTILDRIQDAYIGQVDSGGQLQKSRLGETGGWLFVEQDWSAE